MRLTRSPPVAEIAPLGEALAELVHDGDSVALEGFTHLIPFAAGHELLRQRRRELELIRMTPDILYDQMIGRRRRPQARLLVRRQPWGRLAAPPPRRGRARLAASDRARGALARRHGEPLRGGRGAAAVCRDARLHRDRSRRAHARGADHVPVHGRGAGRRPGAASGRGDRPRPGGRRATATCSCGGSRACRRRPCWLPTARW